MSFSKRSDHAAVFYTKPLDSLKKWNDRFFWVDASVFPLTVPWHSAKSLRKDSPPAPDEFSAEACDFLADNPAPFKKFPKVFLCLVGISRYYTLDENSYPTFWDDEDGGAEMDLFAFIHHADPTKVKIGEREIMEGDIPLLELTKDRVVPLAATEHTVHNGHVVYFGGIEILEDDEAQALVADKPKKLKKRKTADGVGGFGLPPKKLREDHGTSGDASATTAGKSLTVLQDLLDKSILATGVGATTAATIPLVTSSVAPIPEHEGGEYVDFVSAANVRTRRLAERFVISSDTHDSNANVADDEVSSFVRSIVPSSSIPIPAILTTTVATTVVTGTSIPRPRDVNEATHASIFADSTSAGNVDPDAAGPSQPSGNDISSESFYVSLDMDSEALHQSYVPKWDVLNDSLLDDSNVCRSVVDQVAPPVFFSQLRVMKYDQLFSDFNVGAARQTCLSTEVRMRLEHLLMGKKRLEGKCGTQEKLLKERDLEIADLKARLSLKVAEEAARACELGSLKKQSVALESTAAAKDAKIAKLSQDLSQLQLSCDDLSIKSSTSSARKINLLVSSLEVICYELRGEVSGYQLFKERIEEMQDAQVKVLSDRVASMDSNLMALVLHMDEEFFPRFLTTLAGRRWILSRGARLLVVKCLHSPEYMTALGGAIGHAIKKGKQDGLATGIDHGQAGRVLADVATYDPSAEANYLAAINDLHSVDFSLLAQLESQKDASIIDIMDLLHLEEDQVVIREISLSDSLEVAHNHVQRLKGDDTACRLSLTDAMVPFVEPLSIRSLTGEVSTSEVPAVTTALPTASSQTNIFLPGPSFDVPPSPRIVSE
ncbi:hypothetical protein Tco_0807755 [Tanacetum coccineum]